MIVNVSVEIARPRDQVFELMADARNEPHWNSQVTRADLISDEPIGLGTEFTATRQGQEYVAILSSYERPRSLGFSVVGRMLEIDAMFEFADSGEGTTVTAQFDLRPQGFMKLTFPLMGGAVRRDFPRQLDSFKRFCESHAGS